MAKKEVLSRVLDILGIGKPKMNDFDSRLQLQKIIYLLQASGLSLGYGYNWYVKGPYSPSLTKTLYRICESDDVFEKSKEIRFRNNQHVVKALAEFRKKLGENIDDTLYLEVLASLHYINKVTFSGNGEYKQLKNKLLNAKPSLIDKPGIEKVIKTAHKDLVKFS